MYTTLNKIRAHGPCSLGWLKLLRYLGKAKPDDEPLSLATILKSNGLGDAIWCLRAVDGCEREMRLFAVKCARRVQHLMTDQRSLNALDVAEAYANGLASDEELGKAWEAAQAAWDPARESAAQAARESAAQAAREAAWDAAWEAARSAWAAAAWDAAWEAARSAWAAAAWDAAHAASWASAWMPSGNSDFQEKLFIDTFINREGESNVQDS